MLHKTTHDGPAQRRFVIGGSTITLTINRPHLARVLEAKADAQRFGCGDCSDDVWLAAAKADGWPVTQNKRTER